MVESVSPAACLSMLTNYCVAPKVGKGRRVCPWVCPWRLGCFVPPFHARHTTTIPGPDVMAQTHACIRSKAGAVVVAAAYRLAMTDVKAFDEVGSLLGLLLTSCITLSSAVVGHLLQDTMVRCLRLCEPLLAGGAACRQAAKKLAVVVFSAFDQGQHPPSKEGEDAWVSGHGCVSHLVCMYMCTGASSVYASLQRFFLDVLLACIVLPPRRATSCGCGWSRSWRQPLRKSLRSMVRPARSWRAAPSWMGLHWGIR